MKVKKQCKNCSGVFTGNFQRWYCSPCMTLKKKRKYTKYNQKRSSYSFWSRWICCKSLKISHLYAIRQEGTNYVKLGFSKKPWARMATLQTGNPTRLLLVWTEKCLSHEVSAKETLLHKKMSRFQLRGEWFDVPMDDHELRSALSLMVKSPQG